MSEVIEKESAELVALPTKETALTVYSTAGGLDPYLACIKAEIDAFEPDISTAKGRAAIASMAFKVAKIKTAIEALGKTVSAELKEIPKKVDAERKRTREKLEQWQAEVRRPLTEWEEAEEKRKQERELWIEGLRLDRTAVYEESTAEILQINIDCIEKVEIDGDWLGEYEVEAHRVKSESLEMLRDALAKRQRYEAEQAELAKLRAEAAAREQKDREERIAREAEERARREAEAKAQAERDAAAKREADAKAAAERAEREKLEAIERQKQAEARAEAEKLAAEQRAKEAAERARLAEAKRQADEKAREEAEAKRREADRIHRQSILRAAKEAIMEFGFTEEQAVKVVKLIAAGKVPNVSISY